MKYIELQSEKTLNYYRDNLSPLGQKDLGILASVGLLSWFEKWLLWLLGVPVVHIELRTVQCRYNAVAERRLRDFGIQYAVVDEEPA